MAGPEDISKATRQESTEPSQQYESFEQYADKPQEVAKPKTQEEIHAEIERIDSKIATERATLNETREKLGLPPTDTSVAIESFQRQRERLLDEKQHHNELSTSRPSSEQIGESAARQSLTNVSDNIGRLATIFRRRDNENLYPLLERQDVSRLGLAAQSLNARSLTSQKDREEAAQALETMSQAFDKFGSYKATAMRENPDSLKAIATFAGESMTHLRTLQRAVASGDAEEVARAAGQLANKLEDVRNKTVAVANRTNRYLGR